jgi:DNA repair protein RadC
VVLLDVQNYWIASVDVCKGTLDESLAHPRDIFRAVIVHAAAGFVLVHNHPSGVMPYPVLRRMEYGAASNEALSDAA